MKTKTTPLTTEDVRRLRRALLNWYRKNHRRLPWRSETDRTPDPYRVLVSEAMLQQTQVATVVGYFNRFMEALPDVAALAEADEQAVLKLWQGLGYYRRARHLHAAARQIVEHHGGRVPDTVAGLMALPGVGRYSAGAVASIAHGVRAPVVDGNVIRVLSRLRAIDRPADEPATRESIWQLAGQLVPDGRRRRKAPGDFNQALMELGAMICTPKQPECARCPWRRPCLAHRAGRVDELPVPPKRAKQKPVTHRILAVEHQGRFLFERRGDRGLWAGLWQLPTHESARGDLADWAAERFGLQLRRPQRIARFKHQTTHRKITFHLWHGRVHGGRLRPLSGQWRRAHELTDLPLANPQCRALSLLHEALNA